MRASLHSRLAIVGLLFCLVIFPGVTAGANDGVVRARRAIASGRYAAAESTLSQIVRVTAGRNPEALFLLAGLQTKGARARSLYGEAIRLDTTGRWAQRARLEVAKIDYALGRYAEAWSSLDESDACDDNPQACLFEGLSALMLQRYDDARSALRRIHKGQMRTWAWLAMAEADAKKGRPDEACRRYEALSDAMVSPTAVYRYGECLENRGDTGGAIQLYKRLDEQFSETPEGVLAAEKVHRLSAATVPGNPPQRNVNAESVTTLERGFTIQFGSFRDRGNAIKLASRIRRVYPGVRIDTELVDYREYHRVRYGYFHSRDEAERAAHKMANDLNEAYSIMPIP